MNRLVEEIKVVKEVERGGLWLGTARRWMQRNVHNGYRIIFGSDTEKVTLSTRQIEDLVAQVVVQVLLEERKNTKGA